METDNRWGTGSLQEKVPDTATAAYGARWIDHGETMDIVPDRQGFAWDVEADVKRLILAMQVAKLREAATRLPRDEPTEVFAPDFDCWMRRSGGYVYVVAWID